MRKRVPGDRGLAFVIVGMIGATLLWVDQTRARPVVSPSSTARGETAPNDVQFLQVAGETGLAGALMAELAQRKGGEPVRRVAREVSSDFRWFNQELGQIASGRGLRIPPELNAEKQAAYDTLAALDGAEFDRLWASRALEMHDAAAAALKLEASEGSDPEMKRFAQRNLPVVERRIGAIADAASEAGLLSRPLADIE